MWPLIRAFLSVFAAAPICILSAHAAGSEAFSEVYALYSGEAISTLDANELAAFDEGLRWFATVWLPEHGLGPLYNGRACVECHGVPTAGGTALESHRQILLQANSLALRRYHIDGSEAVTDSVQFARRRPPILYGLGLLERIPEATLRALADPEDVNGDGIRGRIRETPLGLGRFGWDAGVADLQTFVKRAFQIELGLTPLEVRQRAATGSADPIHLVTFFIRNLAAPRPQDQSVSTRRGSRIFQRIGCDNCHRPAFDLPMSEDGTVPKLTIRPYTDLLLHRVYEGVGDTTEIRTPPLWGLKAAGPPYLHDGSAKSLEAALLAHGGEAATTRTRLLALPEKDRVALVDFLEHL